MHIKLQFTSSYLSNWEAIKVLLITGKFKENILIMTSIISTSPEKLKSNYKADWVLKNVTNDEKTRIESKNFSVRLGKKTTKW